LVLGLGGGGVVSAFHALTLDIIVVVALFAVEASR